MGTKSARANVRPVRQRTQYTCVSCSTMMALQAWGIDCDEEEVNSVIGARPMKGATWENVLAACQHYGMRAHLVVPSTIRQLKAWTDRGVPVLIAWNPEGRDWSHASVVFDVDDEDQVWVADPNIPDPEETYRVVPRADFYKKWYEKWPDYLVRRPACAIEPEISAEGLQRFAAKKPPSWWRSSVRKSAAGDVYEFGGDTYISEDLMQQILEIPGLYDEKMAFGWLVKTGLTLLDEVTFIRRPGGSVFTPKGKPVSGGHVYEVVEREPAVSKFRQIILPLVEGKGSV